MWVGNNVDIEVQRNAIKRLGLTFVDGNTGLPISLSGYNIYGAIKQAAGSTEKIQDINIQLVDLPNGIINITINGTNLINLPGSMETVTLAYDIIVDDGNGPQVIMRGNLFLNPGVS